MSFEYLTDPEAGPQWRGLLPGRPERSHREHTAIVGAIAAGDGDAAEKAMRRHLDSVARALRERVAAAEARQAGT